jgi:peptidoglycan hydrolase CwlO-like protein
MTNTNIISIAAIIISGGIVLFIWIANRYFNSIENTATANIKISKTEETLEKVCHSLEEVSTKITTLTTKFESIENTHLSFLKGVEDRDKKLEKQQEQINKLELKLERYISEHKFSDNTRGIA